MKVGAEEGEVAVLIPLKEFVVMLVLLLLLLLLLSRLQNAKIPFHRHCNFLRQKLLSLWTISSKVLSIKVSEKSVKKLNG